jgi:hypothetical protein
MTKSLTKQKLKIFLAVQALEWRVGHDLKMALIYKRSVHQK